MNLGQSQRFNFTGKGITFTQNKCTQVLNKVASEQPSTAQYTPTGKM